MEFDEIAVKKSEINAKGEVLVLVDNFHLMILTWDLKFLLDWLRVKYFKSDIHFRSSAEIF